MKSHDFGETKTRMNREYRVCKKCKKVNFVGSDGYFNMFCAIASNETEDLRRRIETEEMEK